VRKIATRQSTTSTGRVHRDFACARAIASQLLREAGIRASKRTIQRDLVAMGAKCRVRRPVPTRKPADFACRLEYARRYVGVSARRFVFSDECWVTANEGGRYMWIFDGEEVLPRERQSKWNVSAIQIWAACGWGYKGPIVMFPAKAFKTEEDGERVFKAFRLNADQYKRRCLSKIVPFLQESGRIFVQDGAKSHAAGSVAAYLSRKNVETAIKFPAYSPDLNMAECIWSVLKDAVGLKYPDPTDIEDLKVKIQEAWDELPMKTINQICGKYAQHLAKVVARKGRT